MPILGKLITETITQIDARAAEYIRGEGALPSAVRNELKTGETTIKYAGYLQQQERAIGRLKKAEQRTIPEWFDHKAVSGLSREINETLQRVRPRTPSQASRISSVTPAALS